MSLFLKKHLHSTTEELFQASLSGITVGLAQLPEAISFAFVAGVEPTAGLHAAWIVCLFQFIWR